MDAVKELDFYKTEVQDIKLCCSYHFVAEKIVPFKMVQ